MTILPQPIEVGQQYRHWTVVGDVFLKNVGLFRKRFYVPCRCACGVKREIEIYALRHISKSCGCVKRDKLPIMPGQRYGRLVVIGPAGKDKGSNRSVLCQCDCGAVKSVRRTQIVLGTTVSCGCYRRDKKSTLSHGGSKTRLYRIWVSMRSRCHTDGTGLPRYGGRGITVCQEWQNSFSAFRSWSEIYGYTDKLSIDRIDNDGNYEPSNCRWANVFQQSNNRSTNRRLTCFGETKTMIEWLRDERCTISDEAMAHRLYHGWSESDAVSLPPYDKSANTNPTEIKSINL